MKTLAEIARQAMLDRGLLPDFPPEVEAEAVSLQAPATPPPDIRDLRAFLWISIDNDDSLDLDQLTYAEDNKMYVAVADVDALVKPHSPIDNYAASNTTSVYTPTLIFPMLPPKLSTNLTSLNEQSDRLSIVVEIDVATDGQFETRAIYPALVRNRAKLTYNNVAAFIESHGQNLALLPPLEGLGPQIVLQDRLAQRMKENRYRQGALSFGTVEVQPTIENSQVVGLKESLHNRANALIENCMIAANVGVTRFLIDLKLPTLKRIVREPLHWDRIVFLAKERGATLPPAPDVKALRDFLLAERRADPVRFPDLSLAIIKLIGRGEYIVAIPGEPSPGHFDLALLDYAHTTAPNRRYPDLIMQRLLKNHFYGGTNPYSKEELVALAAHCTQKEDDATKVERRVRKSAAAIVLKPQIGHTFEGIITGCGEKGTWVRLFAPPVEGRLTHGFQGCEVGDRLTVKLLHVDVDLGHIDFAVVK